MGDMTRSLGSRHLRAAVLTGATVGVVAILALSSTPAAQNVSNVGLCLAAFAAGSASFCRARVDVSSPRFWRFLGAGLLSWSAGQAAWTWYESVLGREVPFPSVADM